MWMQSNNATQTYVCLDTYICRCNLIAFCVTFCIYVSCVDRKLCFVLVFCLLCSSKKLVTHFVQKKKKEKKVIYTCQSPLGQFVTMYRSRYCDLWWQQAFQPGDCAQPVICGFARSVPLLKRSCGGSSPKGLHPVWCWTLLAWLEVVAAEAAFLI